MPAKKAPQAGSKKEVPLTNAEKHVIKRNDEDYRRRAVKKESKAAPK